MRSAPTKLRLFFAFFILCIMPVSSAFAEIKVFEKEVEEIVGKNQRCSGPMEPQTETCKTDNITSPFSFQVTTIFRKEGGQRDSHISQRMWIPGRRKPMRRWQKTL